MPDPDLGRIAMHNIIPRLSETPGRLRTPAPSLGEHTEEILGEFGIDRATLEELAREGVIGLGASSFSPQGLKEGAIRIYSEISISYRE